MHLLHLPTETMRYCGLVEELVEVSSRYGDTSAREKEAIMHGVFEAVLSARDAGTYSRRVLQARISEVLFESRRLDAGDCFESDEDRQSRRVWFERNFFLTSERLKRSAR